MSTATPASVGALAEGGEVVIVGENSRNAEILSESLSGHDVSTVTDTTELDMRLGENAVDAVLVDTERVSDAVVDLVRSVLDRSISVVLLSKQSSPRIERSAATTEGLTFAEKPVRSDELRAVVDDVRA